MQRSNKQLEVGETSKVSRSRTPVITQKIRHSFLKELPTLSDYNTALQIVPAVEFFNNLGISLSGVDMDHLSRVVKQRIHFIRYFTRASLPLKNVAAIERIKEELSKCPIDLLLKSLNITNAFNADGTLKDN